MKVAGVEYHECPHCWFVSKSKSGLTLHINKVHWDKEEE